MSLAPRLLLVLLLPVALCFAAFGFGTVRLRRQLMTDEASRELRDHATALQVALDAVLRDSDAARLSAIAEDLSRPDRVLGIIIYDVDDRPMQASQSVTGYRDELVSLARSARLSGRTVEAKYQFLDRPVYACAFVARGGAVHAVTALILRDLSYIDANVNEFKRQVLTVSLVVMCIIALGSWLSMRLMVARPLAALVHGVEQVAKGDLAIAIPIERHDEIGRLGKAFNHMTASLRHARVELEAKQEANLALERRLQHAQRLALVGQLAATFAHQIGSPLNVVLGRARFALKQGGQGDRDRRHFQEIIAGGESISRVIEQLLSQTRRVRGPAGPVDLGRVAQSTLQFLEAECERSGIRTSIEAENETMVRGRRDELEQVILNLCLNAIQAQPEGGRLTIVIRRRTVEEMDGVEVEVADAGPGVPAELRERIFEAFFTTKAPGKGTGLGLAICEEIVRRHGGTISVFSASEGRGGGAVFRVSLPSLETQLVQTGVRAS